MSVFMTPAATPSVMELVTTLILTSPATTFDFTGLTGDYWYLMLCDLKENNAGTSVVSLYVNNDTTATNYYQQQFQATAGASGMSRTNDAQVVYVTQNDTGIAEIWIKKDTGGFFSALSHANMDNAAAVAIMDFYLKKTATITDITRLTLVSQRNLSTNSNVRLYRVKAV